MRVQPLIAVEDVRLSSRWYQRLLGCVSGLDGNEYEQLVMPGEASFFLQLHAWEAHGDPNLGPSFVRPGHGVLLWFEVEDFDDAVNRAREMTAWIIREPHVNARANHRECWLHDPDGYRWCWRAPLVTWTEHPWSIAGKAAICGTALALYCMVTPRSEREATWQEANGNASTWPCRAAAPTGP